MLGAICMIIRQCGQNCMPSMPNALNQASANLDETALFSPTLSLYQLVELPLQVQIQHLLGEGARKFRPYLRPRKR